MVSRACIELVAIPLLREESGSVDDEARHVEDSEQKRTGTDALG
jgi:hypothetical protein